MKVSTKVGLIAAGLLFVMMAAVQYNDVDASMWIAVYTISAALSFGAAFVPMKRRLPIFQVVVAVALLIVVLVSEGLPELGDNELLREVGGLVVVMIHAVWVATVVRSPFDRWVDGRPI